jgi:hypothetical protein
MRWMAYESGSESGIFNDGGSALTRFDRAMRGERAVGVVAAYRAMNRHLAMLNGGITCEVSDA